MSGHSKWHNIQVRKGKQDIKKSGIFTKCARAISVAVQEGGSDTEMNFTLRLGIEKAKAAGMPKDNIERAIAHGMGELKDGAVLTELCYEGFGPSGIAFLVEVLTDNVNRSAADMKHVFSKNGGSLGTPGSVQWQFQRMGVIRLDESQKSNVKSLTSDFELSVIEAGADDILEEDEGVEIRCPVEKFQSVLEAVQKYVSEPADAGIEWLPKDAIHIDDAIREKVAALYDAFDKLDDVRAVYTNEA